MKIPLLALVYKKLSAIFDLFIKKLNEVFEYFLNNKLLLVVTLAIASRFIIFFIIAFSRGFSPHVITDSLTQWDSIHYLEIASIGYDQDISELPREHELCNQGTGYCQRNFVFFPLYPMLIRSVHNFTGIDMHVVGVAISNSFFILSVALLFLIARKRLDENVAFYSTLAYAFFPISYIFSGIMSESLFIFLLLTTFYFADKKQWLVAGVSAALLSATRSVGILVLISLVLLYLEQINYKAIFKKLNWQFLVAILITPLGLLGFMYFLNMHIGDPFAFINSQYHYGRPIFDASPLILTFVALFDIRLESSWATHLFDLCFFVLSIGLFKLNFFKKYLPLSMAIMLLWVFVPVSSGSLFAVPRYITVVFPMYILLGIILSKLKPELRGAYIALSAMLLGGMTMIYIQGAWVTA